MPAKKYFTDAEVRESKNRMERERYARTPSMRVKKREQRRGEYSRATPERKAAMLEYQRRYLKENKEKAALMAASRNHKRRHGRVAATPVFANRFFMEEAYDLARRRTKLTGFAWHVDHVVPLRNDLVCGLHYEKNFAVIPGSVNSRKKNRFSP